MAARDDLVGLYGALALHRAAAARLENLRDRRRLPAAARRARGYEAVSVGAALALRPATDGTGDALAPTSHNLGAFFAFGGTPLELFRRHFARGCAPGRGRERGICATAFERGLVGSVALPGTMVEVMAGITLAFRLRGQGRVGVVFSGEDETSTSAWHEGINLAAVQRCPLIVVVHAGDEASARAHTRVRRFARKAPGYGIAGESVDAADVLAVRAAVREAAARARSGGGTTLVEARGCPVLRRGRHDAKRDEGGGRNEGAPGPVARFRALLIAEGVARASGLDEADRRARAAVRVACEQARAESSPAGAGALGGVRADDSEAPPWYRRHPAIRGPRRAAAT